LMFSASAGVVGETGWIWEYAVGKTSNMAANKTGGEILFMGGK